MEKELAERLRDVGNRLDKFPTDVDQLLSLLDEIENLLGKVDQSPSELIQNGYSKLMKVLLAEPLLRHTDADVQVSVASCISEITRITAPEAPYEDDQMKEVFQLIVSSFAELSNKSSRSYDKRASILETVAKIRSCVVMLDLECDALISEMFKHFLSSIRDEHQQNIFDSMETVMTVVLEESEDVSVELLMPILASLKKENEEIPSIARKLGESVLAKCAVKIKPCLKHAVESLGLSLDGYSKIITTICNGSNSEAEHDDGHDSIEHLVGESKILTTSSDGMDQNADDRVAEVVPCEVMEKAGFEEVPCENQEPDGGNISAKPLDAIVNKVDEDDLDTGKLVKVDAKQERTAKKRGRKPCSTKHSEPSHIDSDNEAKSIGQKSGDRERDGSLGLGKDARISLEENQHASPDEEEPPLSPPELLDSEANVSSLSPTKSLPDEKVQELASADSALGKAIDGTSGTEVEPERDIEKKVYLAEEDAPSMDSAPVESADVDSDSEIKAQKRSEKKEDFIQEHESSKNLCAVIAAAADGGSDSEVKAQELPRKNIGEPSQGDEPSGNLISPKLLDGSSDSGKLSGKEKVNLDHEDVQPVLLDIDDEISDSKDKPQRQSGKKAFRTKKATSSVRKGNMLKGRGKSKIEAEDNSGEEEGLTQSAKEGGKSDSDTKPLVQSSKEMTSGRRGRPSKKSGKVDLLEKGLSKKKHGTTFKEGDRSDSQSDGNESGSETKALLQSGKEKTSRPTGRPVKNSGKEYVSKAKLSGKKEDKTNKDKACPTEDNSRTVHMKNKKGRVLPKSDDDQGTIISPKSTPKPFKDDDSKENLKRKRTPGENMASGDIEYGANLVGAKVKIWWPDDKQYYEGIIESFDFKKKKHKVSYTDGDEEVLVLQKEKWEFVDDETMQEEDSNPSSSAKSRSWKRAKRNSSKEKQMDVSPRRGRSEAKSGESKGTFAKYGGKQDSKSKDKTSKAIGTSEESEENWESDDQSMDDVPGAARKSKENKIKARSKFETPKTVTKSKGGRPRGSNTSNGMGKRNSNSAKLKEISNLKEKSAGSGKTVDKANKSADTSSGKHGKKRRRGDN